jgi:hypothetical protein
MNSFDLQQVPTEFSILKWWPYYSKALFILAKTYDPENSVTGNVKMEPIEAQQKMFNFIHCLFSMLPDSTARLYAMDFLMMKDYVGQNLVNRLPKFFYVYSIYHDQILFHSNQFFNYCLRSSSSLFNWVYLFQAFMFMKLKDNGIQVEIPTINQLRDEYHVDKLTITDWGNNLWYILHTTSLYAHDPIDQAFMNYRCMLESLQYLLPCPKCRVHLQQNLQKINLTTCAQTRFQLFKCSWQLHNIVNKDTGKELVSFEHAMSLYI